MKRKKILILEDDKVSSWALSVVLEDAGYETVVAYAGEELLENPARVDPAPAAIISDYHLEGEMDGIETVRLIAELNGSSIPTIITSSRENRAAIRRARAQGFHFCPKPLNPEYILNFLDHALVAR